MKTRYKLRSNTSLARDIELDLFSPISETSRIHSYWRTYLLFMGRNMFVRNWGLLQVSERELADNIEKFSVSTDFVVELDCDIQFKLVNVMSMIATPPTKTVVKIDPVVLYEDNPAFYISGETLEDLMVNIKKFVSDYLEKVEQYEY